MTPTGNNALRQDFTVIQLPSKTFRLNYDRLSVSGTVDEIEAVAQAIYLILNTRRYEWIIHSWNYGAELCDLIGKDIEYCIPEIERRITDALLIDDRIEAVSDFTFTKLSKSGLYVTFAVQTVYGNINAETEVDI